MDSWQLMRWAYLAGTISRLQVDPSQTLREGTSIETFSDFTLAGRDVQWHTMRPNVICGNTRHGSKLNKMSQFCHDIMIMHYRFPDAGLESHWISVYSYHIRALVWVSPHGVNFESANITSSSITKCVVMSWNFKVWEPTEQRTDSDSGCSVVTHFWNNPILLCKSNSNNGHNFASSFDYL